MDIQIDALSAGLFVKGDVIRFGNKRFEVTQATTATLYVRRVGRRQQARAWLRRAGKRLERWLVRNWIIW